MNLNDKEMIFVTLCTLAFIALMFLPSYLIYGKIVGDSKILARIYKNKESASYNQFDSGIINIGGLTITTNPGIPVFSKFHIQNGGVRISRFSKSHKIISDIYKKRPSELDRLTL